MWAQDPDSWAAQPSFIDSHLVWIKNHKFKMFLSSQRSLGRPLFKWVYKIKVISRKCAFPIFLVKFVACTKGKFSWGSMNLSCPRCCCMPVASCIIKGLLSGAASTHLHVHISKLPLTGNEPSISKDCTEYQSSCCKGGSHSFLGLLLWSLPVPLAFALATLRKETDSKHQTWTGCRSVPQSLSDWE